jgi:hypothetical protein
MDMNLADILLYAALLLLVAAFALQTMIRLRMVAIAASIAFLLAGILRGDWALAAAFLVILGLNLWRLAEMRRLVADVRTASGAPLTVDWLLPYMRPLDIPAGHVLFSKGDRADALYFLAEGKIVFDEIHVELQKGALFGEIGIFNVDHRRTATARCAEPCSLLLVSADKVRELYYQNPQFGFYLVGLITQRLSENARMSNSSAGAVV